MKARKAAIAAAAVLALAGAAFYFGPPAISDYAASHLQTVQAGMTNEQIDAIQYPALAWGAQHVAGLTQRAMLLPEDFKTGMDPVPANSSAQTRADLDAMLKMQEEERTPEQVAAISFENEVSSVIDIFVKNGLFDKTKYPNTLEILNVAVKEVSHFIYVEKAHYNRARPVQLEPKLTTVIPTPRHAAYPSGHAGQSWTVALILSSLDPANKDKYEQLAIDIAHRREIAGVHYPADSAAGRQLATNVAAAMMEKEIFHAFYLKAKKEWTGTELSLSATGQ